MKRKIRNTIISAMTAFAICMGFYASSTVNAYDFYDCSNNGFSVNVYYENDIIKEENDYIYFSYWLPYDFIIKLENIYDMSINYLIDDSVKNVDNNYLELSNEYNIKKLKAKDCDIYNVKVNDKAELNELFEKAQKLYDNGKIKNVYTNKNITYFDSYMNGEELTYAEVLYAANLKKILIYSENTIEEANIIGDANCDCDLTVRDCADIALKLAKNNIKNLPDTADFNEDGNINVRDAAAIAKSLAEK